MPVYAPEIERWWLSSGADAFDQLFDVPSLGKKARECGFAQAAHHRLRVVDNDSALQAKFRSSLPEIRSSEPFNYAANPRRNLALASLHVFKHPDDGGLDYSLAMQGMGLLDAAEVHRLRIFSHTKTTLEKYPVAENYLPILYSRGTTSHSISPLWPVSYGVSCMRKSSRIFILASLDTLLKENSGAVSKTISSCRCFFKGKG